MNILIVKPSSLGDIIHTLPVVGLLRENYPDSVISWVVNDTYAELLDLCPDIDNRIVFNRKRLGRLRHCLEVFSFLHELRSHKFDIAIDFQGLLRSSLITQFSGARRRVGFRHARECAPWFYSERILLPANLHHAQDKNIFLARSALKLPESRANPGLSKSEVDIGKMRKLLRTHDVDVNIPLIAVAPAARWQTKTWPPEFFATVLSRVKVEQENAVRPPIFICVGTSEERRIGESIRELFDGRLVNLMGETDLGILTELLRHSAVLLTNDSGPMHLAAAVETPVVAMFGATDADLTGPYGERHAVFRAVCDNAPCFNRVCPNGEMRCHTTIDAGKVAMMVCEKLAMKHKEIN